MIDMTGYSPVPRGLNSPSQIECALHASWLLKIRRRCELISLNEIYEQRQTKNEKKLQRSDL